MVHLIIFYFYITRVQQNILDTVVLILCGWRMGRLSFHSRWEGVIMATIDNKSVKLADAKEAANKINELILQYRELDAAIAMRIKAVEAELAALKEQQARLRKFIKNAPISN